jgi:hypothetical protein
MTAPPVGRGFLAECRLATPAAHTLVGSYDACAAPEALRWLRIILRMLESALGDEESDTVTRWLLFGQRRTSDELAAGHAFTLTLHPAADTVLTFSARPVIYLPLAGRAGGRLPACSRQWTQPMAVATALTQETCGTPQPLS